MSNPMAEPMMRPNEAALVLLQNMVGSVDRLEASVSDMRERMARSDGQDLAQKALKLGQRHDDLCAKVETLDDRITAMEARSKPWFALGGKAIEQAAGALISALVAGLIAVFALGLHHPPVPTPQTVTVYPATAPAAIGAPPPPPPAPVGSSVQLPPPTTRRDP